MMDEKKLTEQERNRLETERIYNRASRCVCKQCGQPLTPSTIIYNKYGGEGLDLYCPNCQMIEYGTEKEIYALAAKFIDKFEFNYYLDMEENGRNERLNIAKICEIVGWVFKNIGLLDKNGLKETIPDYHGTN